MIKWLLTAGLTAIMALSTAHSSQPIDDIEDTLQRFVLDYADDPMAVTITFGIEVDGSRWHVTSVAIPGEPRKVRLAEGFPDKPIFYFTTSSDILTMIDQGQLSGLTAMGAETSDQITPLDVKFTEGYVKPENYDAVARPLIFHFWTRGQPEIAPLSIANSRAVHGAPAVVMYYAKDFRSAVYHIPPQLGREMSPTLTVPFPRVLVTLRGKMSGQIGSNEFDMRENEMIFIPPGAPAQLWNENDEPLSFMFLMFGDGA